MDSLTPSLARLLAPRDQAGHTQHIALGAGAIETLGAWMASERAETVDLVVCDPHTLPIAAKVIETLGEAKRITRLLTLEPTPGEAHLVCDDEVIINVTAILRSSPYLNPIAVGSGTINDITKMASFALERDYTCVPTAASMNGYTSTIGAVLSRGVKRTLSAHQPAAIFADLDVLVEAPPELNQAGFGDLLSKPFSHADWLLSHLIRNIPYDPAPSRLLDEPFSRLLADAAEVGARSHRGIATLMETLLLSGFSMAMAGTSAPASGGEHLVSHYWDMEQHCQHAPLYAFHGTQVGIATRLSALLFDRLAACEQLSVDGVQGPKPQSMTATGLAAHHPKLTPAVLQEVLEQIDAKQRVGPDWDEEMARVVRDWPRIRQVLRDNLMPSAAITDALHAAGCPSKPSDIGVDKVHALRTLKVCRQIRSRYVALDLLADLGVLGAWAQDALAEVEG